MNNCSSRSQIHGNRCSKRHHPKGRKEKRKANNSKTNVERHAVVIPEVKGSMLRPHFVRRLVLHTHSITVSDGERPTHKHKHTRTSTIEAKGENNNHNSGNSDCYSDSKQTTETLTITLLKYVPERQHTEHERTGTIRSRRCRRVHASAGDLSAILLRHVVGWCWNFTADPPSARRCIAGRSCGKR